GELGPTTIRIKQLAVEAPAVSIREPDVQIETAGAWDQQKRTLKLASTTFASSAVALRADNVQLVASKEPALAGAIDFRSDLARLSAWVAPGPQGHSSQLAGQAE